MVLEWLKLETCGQIRNIKGLSKREYKQNLNEFELTPSYSLRASILHFLKIVLVFTKRNFVLISKNCIDSRDF